MFAADRIRGRRARGLGKPCMGLPKQRSGIAPDPGKARQEFRVRGTLEKRGEQGILVRTRAVDIVDLVAGAVNWRACAIRA